MRQLRRMNRTQAEFEGQSKEECVSEGEHCASRPITGLEARQLTAQRVAIF